MDGESSATQRARPPAADAAQSVAQLADEVAWLREELARRHLLDLAAGVLVERYALEPADAAERLLALADDTGQRPEDLAADLLNQAIGPPPAGSTAAESAGPSRQVRRAGELAEAQESLDEVAETLLSEALAPLRACGVLIWRQGAGDCLELVGGAGHSGLERTHWQWVPPLWPTPLRRAHAEGMPLWLPDGPTAPDRLPGPSSGAARAVLPLRGDKGPLGVLLVCWPRPTELPEELRQDVLMLSQVAGRVLAAARRRPSYLLSGPLPRPELTSLLDLLAHPALLVRGPSGAGEPLVEHANQAARHAATGLLGPVPARWARCCRTRRRRSASSSRAPMSPKSRNPRRSCQTSAAPGSPAPWPTSGCCRWIRSGPWCCGTWAAWTAVPRRCGWPAGWPAWARSRTT